MVLHTPAHKHVGDAGKPGQVFIPLEIGEAAVQKRVEDFAARHYTSADPIPSPTGTVTGRMTSAESNMEDVPRLQRTDGDRMLETFAGATACKLWWPTDNGR